MKFVPILLILFLTSCASLDVIRSNNRQNLIKLSPGLSKSEVLTLMGTKKVTSDDGTVITNPYRNETAKTDNGQMCEILFYYTDIKREDGAITDDELTPLVFMDGKLTGWGWSYLGDNIKKYQISVR